LDLEFFPVEDEGGTATLAMAAGATDAVVGINPSLTATLAILLGCVALRCVASATVIIPAVIILCWVEQVASFSSSLGE
jgi:hypothetical protein